MPSLKVVTWNINFRTVAALEPLLDLSPRPDVITLQAVSYTHLTLPTTERV